MKTVVKRLYEGMFLVDSALAASDWDGVNDAIKTVLERSEAEIISIRKWDECKLAYEIKRKSRGTYILAYFRVDGEKIASIERDVQLSEKIIRVLVLNAEHMTEADLEKDTPATAVAKRSAEAAEAKEAEKKVAEEPVKEEPAKVEKSPPVEAETAKEEAAVAEEVKPAKAEAKVVSEESPPVEAETAKEEAAVAEEVKPAKAEAKVVSEESQPVETETAKEETVKEEAVEEAKESEKEVAEEAVEEEKKAE